MDKATILTTSNQPEELYTQMALFRAEIYKERCLFKIFMRGHLFGWTN
jgi:hypothetical protein